MGTLVSICQAPVFQEGLFQVEICTKVAPTMNLSLNTMSLIITAGIITGQKDLAEAIIKVEGITMREGLVEDTITTEEGLVVEDLVVAMVDITS